MRITNDVSPFDEKPIVLTKEERIAQLERRKSSLLHELKIISGRMAYLVKIGAVSDMSDSDKHPNCPTIPDAETRRILTKDPTLTKKVLLVFARFSLVKEIFSNSVMPELEALQNKGEKKS